MNDETKLIEAGTVTKKIAESLAPLPDTPPLLVAIHKKIPQAEPNHYRIEDLTDDDVRLLRDIWAGLPIPAAWNMTQEQFALCKTVFEAAPNKPTWQIQAEFRDYQNEAKGEQRKIATEHMRHIEAEVKNGCFKILTSHRIPTDKLEPGTLMRIADACSYLQSLGLDTSWLSDIEAAPKMEAGTVTSLNDEKPWLVASPNDPTPKSPWYTPARYFARELVKDDSTLLTKRDLLSKKVENSMNSAGIYKRGKKKAPAAITILKAFANVTLG